MRRSIVCLCALLAALGGVFAQETVSLASGREPWKVGDDTFEASVSAVDGDQITLLLEAGKTRKLSLKDLDEAHQQRVSAWSKANAAPEGFGKPDMTVRLQTLQGQMRYDRDEIIVSPGAKVRLVFQNVDDMHHNLVICAPDSREGMDVAQAAWELGAEGFNKEWVPEHPMLLSASPMVNPHATRHMYFTAPDTEGDYPYVCTLPGHAAIMKGMLKVQTKPKAALQELTYVLYKGNFNKLPDFDKLTPEATDHVPSGLIDLRMAKQRDRFALVFDGQLNVPKSGEYTFKLFSDDGSRLEIDGKRVINHDGVHGGNAKDGKVTLSEGLHPIRVSYFERDGEEVLGLTWSGPGFKDASLSAQPKKRRQRPSTGIPLAARDGEARIYRNFIEGAGDRAIGVGYPGGINLAFDADQMRLAMVWLGGFIDAARHWQGRGQGYQPPLGYRVAHGPEGVPFARLGSMRDPWPEKTKRAEGYQFKGYALEGEQRVPVFNYHFGEIAMRDAIKPRGSVLKNDASLVREITLTGAPQSDLYFRVAADKHIEWLGEGRFLVGEDVVMKLGTSPGGKPVLRLNEGEWELLLLVGFNDGKATISQEISYLLTNQ